MIHYQLGQQVGDFTIASYNEEKGTYTLQCKCGNTSEGDSTHVTRKISNLLSDGFTACMECYHKYKAELKLNQEQQALLYTHKDVYREYVKKSKERGIEFTLSLEEAAPLFKSNCYYCGNAPSNKRTRDTGITAYYQGLDRVDNSVGYILSNVVPCCKYCNAFKLDRSKEIFLKHVEQIYLLNVQRPSLMGVDSSESKRQTSQVEDDMVYSS